MPNDRSNPVAEPVPSGGSWMEHRTAIFRTRPATAGNTFLLWPEPGPGTGPPPDLLAVTDDAANHWSLIPGPSGGAAVACCVGGASFTTVNATLTGPAEVRLLDVTEATE